MRTCILQFQKIILSMKRIQRGSLKPVKALAAPPFKSNHCLVFVPAVPETSLQLVKATLQGGGDGGWRETEGLTKTDRRDNDSCWD